MKKIYVAFLAICLLTHTACKKDNPHSYEKMLTHGTWELYDLETPSYMNPPFLAGDFSFLASGRIQYKDLNGKIYDGHWEHTYHADIEKHSLYIEVTDPVTGDKISEFFDKIDFTNSSRFQAYIFTDYNTNIFRFRLKQ